MINNQILPITGLLAFLIMSILPTFSNADSLEPLTTTPGKPITVATVTSTPVNNQIELIGTVIAKHSAEIAGKVTGTIADLPVQLGSAVREGDLLVSIDAGEIDARVQQAEAQRQQANRNLARERKLLTRDAATSESVKSFSEALAIAEAAFKEAQTIQTYTRIKAPFSGIVTAKHANEGDLATPGKVLLEIENLDQLQILTEVPEAHINDITLGQELPIQLPSARITLFGKVVEIAPTTNPTTRSGAVKLDIASTSTLRPGQFARVVISSHGGQTLTVPTSSVIHRGQLEIVFVIQEDNEAKLRLVKTGNHNDKMVEILSGLDEGERIATAGHEQLLDSQTVKIK